MWLRDTAPYWHASDQLSPRAVHFLATCHPRRTSDAEGSRDVRAGRRGEVTIELSVVKCTHLGVGGDGRR